MHVTKKLCIFFARHFVAHLDESQWVYWLPKYIRQEMLPDGEMKRHSNGSHPTAYRACISCSLNTVHLGMFRAVTCWPWSPV